MPSPSKRTESPSRRDLYLDYWRGLFHVVLILDHLPILFSLAFSWLFDLYEGLGFFSVAEGFVFLSGYVTAIVYARIETERGPTAMFRKAIVRAVTIYATYVVAILVLILFVKLCGPGPMYWSSWSRLFDENVPKAFWETASSLWRPTFLEILPMYSLFLLFTPLILASLNRGQHWLVLCASGLLWSMDQFNLIDKALLTRETSSFINLGFFHAAAWQVLFIGGLFCGYKTHSRKGERWLPKSKALAIAVASFMIVMFMLRHHFIKIEFNSDWTERSSLGFLRLLNFAAAVFLISRFRQQIQKLIAWEGLAFLSRHSLQVFAFHLVPILIAALLFPENWRLLWWGRLLFIAFCISGLFCIAWLSSLVKGCWRKTVTMPATTKPIALIQSK